MSEFVCKKPLSLSGRNFAAGEVIPDGFVLPNRENALIRSNYIAEIKTSENTPLSEDFGKGDILIPVVYENGTQEVRASPNSVYSALLIMQKNLSDATADISVLTDEDALMILNEIDMRAGVKKAAGKRLDELATKIREAFLDAEEEG